MMIAQVLSRLAKFAWILPGFLLWAAFAPMNEGIDALFALAPLIWYARRSDAKKSALAWFFSGFFFWVATLSWMPAIIKNGGPWPLVVLGWGVLALYCALYFAAFGFLSSVVWAWVRPRAYRYRILTILLVEPILWCGLELIRSRFGGGFAWNQLGVVAITNGFGSPAAFGGVYLCSAVVILLNGTIASIAERMWKPDPSLPKAARPLETLLPFILIWALYQLPVRLSETASELKVGLLQRNFPCCFSEEKDEDSKEVYSNLVSFVSHVSPDLLILSESAMCEFGRVNSTRAIDFARELREASGARAVIAGGAKFEGKKEFNSAALYTDSGFRTYDKVHLVPFGEFIPGDKLIPALQKLAPVGSCTSGKLKTLDFEGEKLGLAICYEDTDSAQIRRLAEMGAKLLVFITNDSWFSESIEARQHAAVATARAVETGLDVVRVGNSGVSGTVSPDGRANWIIDERGEPLVDGKGSMVDKVRLREGSTVYVKLGDKPLFIAFSLLILAIIVVKYTYEHQQNRYVSL